MELVKRLNFVEVAKAEEEHKEEEEEEPAESPAPVGAVDVEPVGNVAELAVADAVQDVAEVLVEDVIEDPAEPLVADVIEDAIEDAVEEAIEPLVEDAVDDAAEVAAPESVDPVAQTEAEVQVKGSPAYLISFLTSLKLSRIDNTVGRGDAAVGRRPTDRAGRVAGQDGSARSRAAGRAAEAQTASGRNRGQRPTAHRHVSDASVPIDQFRCPFVVHQVPPHSRLGRLLGCRSQTDLVPTYRDLIGWTPRGPRPHLLRA